MTSANYYKQIEQWVTRIASLLKGKNLEGIIQDKVPAADLQTQVKNILSFLYEGWFTWQPNLCTSLYIFDKEACKTFYMKI